MALPYIPINYVDHPHRRLLPHTDPVLRGTDARFGPELDMVSRNHARGVQPRRDVGVRERPVHPVPANLEGYQKVKREQGQKLPNPIYFGKTAHGRVEQLVVDPYDPVHYQEPFTVASSFLNH